VWGGLTQGEDSPQPSVVPIDKDISSGDIRWRSNALRDVGVGVAAAAVRPPDHEACDSCALGVAVKDWADLMTTMAAMFGAVPLAIGFGEGAELRRPLGITIVGGLLVSQLLTLYTTPVIYLYLDRLRLWTRRPWRIREPRLADEGLPEPGE
jgi:hypothetical protein